MIYTPLVNKTLKLMFEKHKDQVDKAGVPYVFHPFSVAFNMQDEVRTVVALLHDIVEDTDVTLEDLTNMGYPDEVIEALACMTHGEGEDYFEYVQRVGTNPIATDVKLSDLTHNMRRDRLPEVTEKWEEKNKKYIQSFEYLTERHNEFEASKSR